MSKRATEDKDIQVASKAPFGKLEKKVLSVKEIESMGEFEDPWEDEYETESEEEVVEEDESEDNEVYGMELDKIKE